MARKVTVGQLIEWLQEQDGDAEVRLGMQPSYPFEYTIAGAVSAETLALESWEEPCEECGARNAVACDCPGNDDKPEAVVYLLEGTQLGYFRRDAWDAAERIG